MACKLLGKVERFNQGKHNQKEIEWEVTPTTMCVSGLV